MTLRADESLEATLPLPEAVAPAPANATGPFRLPGPIAKTPLPLHIGADSDGANRFRGDLARVSVFDRVLSADELRLLADQGCRTVHDWNGCVASWNFDAPRKFESKGEHAWTAEVIGQVASIDGRFGKAIHLDGRGYLSVAHDPALDCTHGVTLEAWIRPAEQAPGGGRILDKSPAGHTGAYLLDTYPHNSLRLIVRNPQLRFAAKLDAGTWVHVAATVDGDTGESALYLNGTKVASQR